MKAEHRQPPRGETLARLARALELPYDVVRAAAVAAAGYELESVTTTLEASEDLRVVAAAMSEMDPRDRHKLRRLALAFLEDRAAAQVADQSEVDRDAQGAELSAALAEMPGPTELRTQARTRRTKKK